MPIYIVMMAIVASADNYLGENIARIAREEGLRPIRSASIERLKTELKKPNTLVIVDMDWEEIQGSGVLRQLVNLGRIAGGRVVCVCPNADEKLKKIARNSGCDQWFIRYDLETRFREHLRDAKN